MQYSRAFQINGFVARSIGKADIPRAPAKNPDRQFKVGDKVRANLHYGKIEDAIVKAVIQHTDGTKLQLDVVGLDITALIDARQVVEEGNLSFRSNFGPFDERKFGRLFGVSDTNEAIQMFEMRCL